MRFTALPRGLSADGRPRLSAHAAFRLEPGTSDGLLADFPAALDWPTQTLTWTLRFRLGSATVDVPAGLDGPDQRDAAKWAAIFGPDLPVRAFTPPATRSALKIRTFRASRLADRWRSLYTTLGAQLADDGARPAVGDDPATGPLAGFEAAGLWSQDRAKDFDDQTLLDGLEAALATLKAVPADLGGTTQARERRDILEFRRFFRRQVNDPDAVVLPPALDFHQLTTACGAHPGLLRPLGLVVDLVADASGWPGWDEIEKALSGFPTAVSLVGRPAGGGLDPDVAVDETTPVSRTPFTVDPAPWTRCRADQTTFGLAPAAGGDLSERLLLRLDDPARFAPVTLDVEPATFGAVGFGGTLQLMTARRTRSTPTNEAPPALRASGIALTRVERALTFHQRVFERGDAIVAKLLDSRGSSAPSVDDLELEADDVLKGYRLDVRPQDGTWRSVVLRRGRVEVAGAEGWDLDDAEGWVVEALSGDDVGELYLGEEVIRWDGWSPVAPKPGTVIGTDDQLDPDRASSAPVPGLPVVVSYRPTPGSLVPLRYGRRYQLRARAVDIAGNGPSPDDLVGDPQAGASAPVLFGRLDPVRSPDLLLTAPRLPGEEPERVVLRSQWWDRPAAETGERLAARHVLPPRTTVTEAERHGVLDRPDGRPDPGRYALLAERDAYALQDDPLAVEDPDDPTPGQEGTSRFFTDLGADRWRLDRPGAIPVGYLPDPLARAVEVWRADGSNLLPAGTVLDLGDGWPERRSARIVVVEGDAVRAEWDAGERVLRVSLPKAAVLPLRLSSRFAASDVATFSLTEWLAQSLGVEVSDLGQNLVGRQVRAGRHWMVTPWRPLTLVHAVKQPLTEPKLDDSVFSVVSRPLAATASDLGFPARWHAASTGRLDLLASWDEGVDAGPGTPAPEVRRVQVLAAELRRDQAGAPDTDGAVEAARRPVHEHGDTKYRRISYSLEATTAFLDNFIETRAVTFPAEEPVVLPGVAVPSTVVLRRRVVGADGEPQVTTYRRDDGDGGDYRVVIDDAADATTLARIDDAVPSGEPLTVGYATRPVSRVSPTAVVRDVPASARPAAPLVHSVLPTFGWDSGLSGTTATSARQQAGVRVWLERPWWSSGLGEQLAVLYLGGTAQPSEAAEPFVTVWGRDPVHAGGSVRAALSDAAFSRRRFDSIGLRPPGGPLVRAVPHTVVFDPDRDMWFCDIDVDLDSYWPFVRLALARWQPNAIVASDPPGSPADTTIALSPAVLADIVQLAPGRTATVTGSRSGATRRLAVSVVGPSYLTTVVDTAAPVVEATLQRRPPGATSDLDWQTVAGPVTLTREAFPVPFNDGPTRRHRWTGALEVTSPPPGAYRVVLEEHERYRTDGSVTDVRVVRTRGRITLAPQPRDGRRLVYTDVIEVAAQQLA
jgi:hypothetical protein